MQYTISEKNRNDIDVVLNTLQPLAKHKRNVKKQKYFVAVDLLFGYDEAGGVASWL